MTRTQHVWGGSHDAILGMMLWLHQTPLYPVSFAYRSDRMKAGSLATFQNDYTEVLERAIIVHDVYNPCARCFVFALIDTYNAGER